MQYPINGSCQCGRVKYKLLEKPAMVIACHCNECQILSSSVYSITSIIDSDKIEFEGEMNEWSRPAESGNVSAAKFCPNCGNRIYHYNPLDPDKLKLKLKPSIPNDCVDFKPASHIWTSQRMEWFDIPDDAKNIEGQP
jgi:hypothetical protein